MLAPSARAGRVVAAGLLAAAAAAFAQERAASEAAPASEAAATTVAAAVSETVTIPVTEASGEVVPMVAQVFRPVGAGPFPVVVFSHGRAPAREARAALKQGVSRAQLRYWLARGAAVVSPIRPGYGASPGGDLEQSGARFDGLGRCTRVPEFRRTADPAALTIAATLAWLPRQPWADAQDVLLVGQSVGGLATVAAGARRPAGVVGLVNFAGGSGGNPALSPGVPCDPGQLVAMYTDYGRTTTLPNLWVYARNDQYWGPDIPRAWHAVFARGGSPSTFAQLPAVADGDGHGLSRHAQALWAPTVDAFLATTTFGQPHAASAPP